MNEAERLRAALSECGLFQEGEPEAAPPEPPPEELNSVESNVLENSNISTVYNISEGTAAELREESSGILEALDRVFSGDATNARRPNPANVNHPKVSVAESRPADSAVAARQPSTLEHLIQAAAAAGAERLHLESDGEVLRGFLNHNGNITEIGAVKRLELDGMFANRSAACAEMVINFQDAERTVQIKQIRTRAIERFVVTGLPAWTPESLEVLGFDADAASHVRQFMKMERGGLVLVVSARGDSAHATVQVLAREYARLGRMVASRIPIDGARASRKIIEFPADTAVRDMLQIEPDGFVFGPAPEFVTMGEAVRAAAGGWRVFASIPASSVEGAIAMIRTLQLDASAFFGTRPFVLYQKSLRALCAACRQPVPTPDLLVKDCASLEVSAGESAFYKSAGCARCAGGFRGRFVVANYYNVEQLMSAASAADAAPSRAALYKKALAAGLSGKTSLDEVIAAREDLYQTQH
ncbi:MAG: hypothetical protein ACKVS6_14570 [Planctomycetota bacterium]